jgi:hypothetical protein
MPNFMRDYSGVYIDRKLRATERANQSSIQLRRKMGVRKMSSAARSLGRISMVGKTARVYRPMHEQMEDRCIKQHGPATMTPAPRRRI